MFCSRFPLKESYINFFNNRCLGNFTRFWIIVLKLFWMVSLKKELAELFEVCNKQNVSIHKSLWAAVQVLQREIYCHRMENPCSRENAMNINISSNWSQHTLRAFYHRPKTQLLKSGWYNCFLRGPRAHQKKGKKIEGIFGAQLRRTNLCSLAVITLGLRKYRRDVEEQFVKKIELDLENTTGFVNQQQ